MSIMTRYKPWIERARKFDINALLIRIWGRALWTQAIAVFLFFLLFLFNHDPVFALVKLSSVIASKGLQWFVLWMLNVRERFLFLWPFGISIVKRNQPRGIDRDNLWMFTQGWIYLSGPIILLFLTVIGFYIGGTATGDLARIGAYMFAINTLATLMSLLPIFKYDGAMVFRLIYRSSGKRGDRFISALLTVGAILLFIKVTLMSGKEIFTLLVTVGDHLGWYGFCLLFISSIWYQQARDDDSLAMKPGTLTNFQKLFHAVMYAVIVIILLSFLDQTL